MENKIDKNLETQFECDDPKEVFSYKLLKIEDVFSFKPTPDRNPFKSHRVDFFTILLITQGTMTHEVDFQEFKMIEGDCLFVCKGQIHKFDSSPTYKGYCFVFSEGYLFHHMSPSALSKINFIYNYHLTVPLLRDFADRDFFLVALKRELRQERGEIKPDIIASILAVFLLKVQVYVSQVLKSYDGEYIEFMKFQNLVSSRYAQTRKVNEYSNHLNITRKQLNKLCKTFTNKTAKEYINDYVVLQAKRLMVISKLTIKQAAFECGFREETNFSKFFKKISGVTPSQFRKSTTYE